MVTRTIESSPADKSGMKSGDEIISINGRSAVGLTPEQAAEQLGISTNAVYVAKSRVLSQLRKLSEGLVDWED